MTYSRVARGPRSKDPRRRPRGPRNSPLSPSCRSSPASCRTAAVPDIRTKTARVPEKPKPPSRRTPINDHSYVSRHVPLNREYSRALLSQFPDHALYLKYISRKRLIPTLIRTMLLFQIKSHESIIILKIFHNFKKNHT